MNLYGIKVVTNTYLTETKQVRFPRSKSKRIRKKWSKNQKNFNEYPSDKVYFTDYNGSQMFICHPAMMDKIREIMSRQGLKESV